MSEKQLAFNSNNPDLKYAVNMLNWARGYDYERAGRIEEALAQAIKDLTEKIEGVEKTVSKFGKWQTFSDLGITLTTNITFDTPRVRQIGEGLQVYLTTNHKSTKTTILSFSLDYSQWNHFQSNLGAIRSAEIHGPVSCEYEFDFANLTVNFVYYPDYFSLSDEKEIASNDKYCRCFFTIPVWPLDE